MIKLNPGVVRRGLWPVALGASLLVGAAAPAVAGITFLPITELLVNGGFQTGPTTPYFERMDCIILDWGQPTPS